MIRTPEAAPFVIDGVQYRCAYPDRSPDEVCYTLHATSAPDDELETALGFKIEDMTARCNSPTTTGNEQ